MSRYDDAEFIPWYTEDTAGWLKLSLGARGAMAEIARKLNKRGERVLSGGLADLADLLRLRWEGELEPAVAELVRVGRVAWDPETRTLSDPDYVARKRKGSAERMQKKRALDAAAKAANDVPAAGTVLALAPLSAPDPSVTCDACDVSSPLLSSDLHDLIPEEIPSARAREPAAEPPALDQPIPPALRARAEGTADQAGAPELDVEASWRGYIAWCAEERRPVSEARWQRWVNDDCAKTKRFRIERRERERRRDGPPPTPKVSPEQEKAALAVLRDHLAKRKGAA